MNYRALSIDELAAACKHDAGAREYAGAHFEELVDGAVEEIRESYEDGLPYYPTEDVLIDFREVPKTSIWWRIG